MKKFVGVDLHKILIVIGVVDQDRHVLTTQRFTNAQADRLAAWLQSLGAFELVLEATASYEWSFKRVEPLAKRIVLARPRFEPLARATLRREARASGRTWLLSRLLKAACPCHPCHPP